METEYTAGALTQAISKKKSKKKKKATEEKKPLEDLFAASPVAVTYVPCRVSTEDKKKKKRKKSTVEEEEEEETVPNQPLKKEESEGKPTKRAKHDEVDSSDDEAEQVPRKKMTPIPRDPNQEERTVFVGNIPNTLKMKKLEKLFKTYGEVESVRIRSVGVADPEMPRKLAVIRRDFHPERKNMNAYVRFKTLEEAKAALALNGQTLKGFCLRVDLANREKQHDQKKCVFLGNLPFSIDENNIHSYFEDCGEIEGVRLIRDSRTGIGKGFGYIQFEKVEAVELALNLDGGQLGGRKIRVSRSLKKPILKKIIRVADKPKRPKHRRENKEELPPGADRKTRVQFFSQLKKNKKPVPKGVLKRKTARKIANGKKNRKVTEGK